MYKEKMFHLVIEIKAEFGIKLKKFILYIYFKIRDCKELLADKAYKN